MVLGGRDALAFGETVLVRTRAVLDGRGTGDFKVGERISHESRRRHSGVEHRDASALEALSERICICSMGTRLMEVFEALGMTFMDAGGLQC